MEPKLPDIICCNTQFIFQITLMTSVKLSTTSQGPTTVRNMPGCVTHTNTPILDERQCKTIIILLLIYNCLNNKC